MMGHESAEELIKIVMRANPDPDDGIHVALTNNAVLFVDTDGPNVLIAAEFFEP